MDTVVRVHGGHGNESHRLEWLRWVPDQDARSAVQRGAESGPWVA